MNAPGTDPLERKRLQLEAIESCRGRAYAYARKNAPPQLFADACKVSMIGVIVAIERYEAADVPPWTHVEPFVREELGIWQRVTGAERMLAALAPLYRPAGTYHRNKPLHERAAEREAFSAALAADPQLFTVREREAVTAVLFEGRSLRAAATHLGVPFGTVRSWVRGARAALRIWLQREAQL